MEVPVDSPSLSSVYCEIDRLVCFSAFEQAVSFCLSSFLCSKPRTVTSNDCAGSEFHVATRKTPPSSSSSHTVKLSTVVIMTEAERFLKLRCRLNLVRSGFLASMTEISE